MQIWRHFSNCAIVSEVVSFSTCARCTFGVVAHSFRARDLHTDRVDPSEVWFDVNNLESMKRQDLQALCKKCGLKANSKTTKLKSDLRDFYVQHVTDSSSILHYPFIVPDKVPSPTPSKSKRKSFIPSGSVPDRNQSLFCQVEPPSHWISGEMGKLSMVVKSKGILCKTVGEYKGNNIEETKGDSPMSNRDTYLTKSASVSAVLNSTSNKLYMISRWQKQQIENMGKEKFAEYRKTLSNSGLKFHSAIQDILQGEANESDHFPNLISGLIQSVAKTEILSSLKKRKIIATEEYVTHSFIGYSGTFDALAIYDGVPCVIEWKTSQKHKPSLESCYDAPLQVVAYAGAINSHPVMRIPVTNCMIVIAHHDGSKADIHWMDLQTCEKLWRNWLLKVLKYKRITEGPKQND
ncbi:uncharacterized protein [Montipora foliosa]|uniref:uncharacterized protein n=1 Tax=Montipora foliosa TaxID=591990 RepID=UPI0035F1AE55